MFDEKLFTVIEYGRTGYPFSQSSNTRFEEKGNIVFQGETCFSAQRKFDFCGEDGLGGKLVYVIFKGM